MEEIHVCCGQQFDRQGWREHNAAVHGPAQAEERRRQEAEKTVESLRPLLQRNQFSKVTPSNVIPFRRRRKP